MPLWFTCFHCGKASPRPGLCDEHRAARRRRKTAAQSERNRQTGRSSYHWQHKIRPAVLERDGHACVHCGSTAYVGAHLLTEADHSTATVDEAVTLCASCHSTHHAELRKLRREQKHR